VRAVAIVAANDEVTGAMVAEALERVGSDGIVDVEYGTTVETRLEVVDGMAFDRGYLSHHMVTDLERMQVVLDNPLILMTDQRLQSLEEVAAIVRGLREIKAAVCLDTAHLFAAGYDIKSEKGLEQTIETIDRIIGLENVPVFHVNDSKIPLGGRVDRHEHIGKGKIGAEAFRRLLTHPRLSALPPEGLAGRAFLAETPIDDPGDDRRNVAALWEFTGLKEQAPEAAKGFSMLTASAKKSVAAAFRSGRLVKPKTKTSGTPSDRGRSARARKIVL